MAHKRSVQISKMHSVSRYLMKLLIYLSIYTFVSISKIPTLFPKFYTSTHFPFSSAFTSSTHFYFILFSQPFINVLLSSTPLCEMGQAKENERCKSKKCCAKIDNIPNYYLEFQRIKQRDNERRNTHQWLRGFTYLTPTDSEPSIESHF